MTKFWCLDGGIWETSVQLCCFLKDLFKKWISPDCLVLSNIVGQIMCLWVSVIFFVFLTHYFNSLIISGKLVALNRELCYLRWFPGGGGRNNFAKYKFLIVCLGIKQRRFWTIWIVDLIIRVKLIRKWIPYPIILFKLNIHLKLNSNRIFVFSPIITEYSFLSKKYHLYNRIKRK